MDSDDERIVPFGRDVEEMQRNLARLKSGDGDGTSGGVTDDWKMSVDRQLGQLHGDVRALLNRGVMAAVALAAMIAGLYLYTNDKFERLNQRLSAVEVQQAKSDAAINGKLDVLLERKEAVKP